MISDTIRKALNEQINTEFNASYTYLGMSTWCERRAYKGAAVWLRTQQREEFAHGMRLYNFMLARDCDVELEQLVKPPTHFESLLGVFEHSLAQELEVSARIDRIYKAAFDEKSYAALVELQWFLTEQVEEERTVREIVQRLKMVKDDPSGLLEIDRELGLRTTVAKQV